MHPYRPHKFDLGLYFNRRNSSSRVQFLYDGAIAAMLVLCRQKIRSWTVFSFPGWPQNSGHHIERADDNIDPYTLVTVVSSLLQYIEAHIQHIGHSFRCSQGYYKLSPHIVLCLQMDFFFKKFAGHSVTGNFCRRLYQKTSSTHIFQQPLIILFFFSINFTTLCRADSEDIIESVLLIFSLKASAAVVIIYRQRHKFNCFSRNGKYDFLLSGSSALIPSHGF